MIARRHRLGVVLLGLLLAGCGTEASPQQDRPEQPERSEITVLAAASLTEAFGAIGSDFEAEHDGVRVRFSFGSSSTLAGQVTDGAPADVYASADERTMQQVVEADRADGEPAIFATNTLQIAVPAGNPGKVSGLRDFADPDRTFALCAAEVPCGAAAERVFDDAGITAAPDSYERDVKAALRKVEAGEVDAALVYATDVVAAGDQVSGIPIEGVDQVPNRYPIVRLTESAAPETAAEFVDYVGSEAAREQLQDAGFGTP